MNWRLIFSGFKSPGWAAYVIIATLLVLVLSFLLLRLERKMVSRTVGWTLVTLRLLVLTTLLLTMLQPLLTRQFDVEQRGRVVVAIDASESMQTEDRHAGLSEKLRWAQALGMLGNEDTRPIIDRWVTEAEAGKEPNWLGTDQPPANPIEQASSDLRQRQVQGALDELAKMPRTEFVRRLLLSAPGKVLDEVAKVMPVDLRLFAGKAQKATPEQLAALLDADRLDIEPGGTNPLQMLQGITAEEGAGQIRGVILISDGRQTTAGDVTAEGQRLAALGIPVFAVPVGSRLPPRDLSLAAVEAPEAVFLNDKAQIRTVVGTSGFEGTEVRIRLEREGNVIDEQTVTPSSDTATLTFSIPSNETGRFDYVLKTEVQTGELREDNNARDLSIQVVDNKARVMLLDGDARWEFRYLKNLLDRDKQVEPVSVLFRQPYLAILNQPSITDKLPPMEAFREQLAVTDLLIVGDVTPAEMEPGIWKTIEEAVTRDGLTLLIIPGRRGMPTAFQSEQLSALLPVTDVRQRLAEQYSPTLQDAEQSAFRLSLSVDAQTLPMFQLSDDPAIRDSSLTSLSGHPWIYAGTPKPGASAWASASLPGIEHAPEPVIVHHDYGFGQVVWMGLDSTWRWRKRAGDEWHYKYWGQLVRWAARNKAAAGNSTVRLTLSDVVIDEGETPEAVVRWDRRVLQQLQGATVEVIAEPLDDSGRTMESSPGETAPAASTPTALTTILQPSADSPERFTGRLAQLTQGTWRVRLKVTGGQMALNDTVEAEVVVRKQLSAELANVACNRELLTQLATLSGGELVEPWDAARLQTLVQPKDQPEQKIQERTLWDHWIVMVIFFVLLTTEWVVRKLNGLP